MAFNDVKEKLAEYVKKWNKANVYIVGGSVRDFQLGFKFPKDIDLCIDLDNGAEEFCKFLKKNYPEECKNFVEYPRFGTSKFTLQTRIFKIEIECVMPRVESYNTGPRKPSQVSYSSIEMDALRRDFCCNALYVNVLDDIILDPTGRGLDDIKNKTLHTPLSPEITFKDDPLRMLRAVRFACTKEFTISQEILDALTDYPEYYQLSMERVRDEFEKIISSKSANSAIQLLHDHKLLKYIIPEFEEAWGFNQNTHIHSMNLTDHCLKTLELCSKSGKDISLNLAALLHDISKYKKYKIENNGEFSFPGHEIDSADMTKNILSRLCFSAKVINKTTFLIRNHMCLSNFYNPMTKKYNRPGGTTRKIARLLGDYLLDELGLIEAINQTHAPGYRKEGQTESFYDEYQKEVVGFREKLVQPVSGDEIIEELNLYPGKLIGDIKEIFQDWYDENPNLTKENLIERYKKEFGNRKFWAYIHTSYYVNVSINPPIKDGTNNYTYDEIPMPIPLKFLPKDPNNYLVPVEFLAAKYPRIYKYLLAHNKLRQAIDTFSDSLFSEIIGMPECRSVTLILDEGGVSGNIDWKNFLTENII